MTEVKRTKHHTKTAPKELQESVQGPRSGGRAKPRVGVTAGSGPDREGYAEDNGPDRDETVDVNESGREFPGIGDGS